MWAFQFVLFSSQWHTHTHREKTTHTHAVTNRNKNGKFCLLCHRHLELNFIYFAIATVIIVRQRDQERPEKGREKVVLSAGCFHQQQDAMLTTTVGLNNNTCRNIIFMPRTGYGVGWVPGAGWGQIVFMTRTRRLGSFSTLSRSLSAVLLSLSLLHPLFEIKNWFYSVKHAIMKEKQSERQRARESKE